MKMLCYLDTLHMLITVSAWRNRDVHTRLTHFRKEKFHNTTLNKLYHKQQLHQHDHSLFRQWAIKFILQGITLVYEVYTPRDYSEQYC